MEYIGPIPTIRIDIPTKKLWVGTLEVKLITRLTVAGESITVEKYRVYVPSFKFLDPWENFLGSDIPSEEEAVETYDKQPSNVFLDKKTRKPLLYTFVIDKTNNLFFRSKRLEDSELVVN